MHHHGLARRLLALIAATTITTAQVLPYTPTKVLLPSNASYAYIFQASTQGTGQSRLSTLPFNNPVSSAAGWQDNTVSGTLPFLRDDDLVPYTPVIDALGGLTVFAGNCSEGAGGAEVWYFAVDEGTLFGNGTWTQYNNSDQGLGSTTTALAGANFLASGIAFSEVLGGGYNDTNLYIFGGMCPLANSTAETWTGAAEYSNHMLTLAPNASTDYDISMVANRGPPIAEAGFSITPLSPTYSAAASSGSGSQKQQQDFVLLGGHTQAAFINMSQVALFSLPQESWTFLPVLQPPSAASTKTDLSARQAATVEVEPRSGHTAVLTEDGESVVLFGGWVGDVSTAAEPQLAVLRLGAGFGGTGDWSWSALAESNSSSSPRDGLYGHGAAMLPGGVMLVVGGYAIPASSSFSSSASSKRAVQSANSQVYFYNVSANTWMDTYTPPADLSPGADYSHGALSNASQKAGLGAGLGIGAAVLIALLIFYLWYTRRLKRARDARGRSLLSHSSDGSLKRTEKPMADRSGAEHRGGDVAAVGRFWNVWDSSGNASAQGDGASQMQEGAAAGSTALFVNIPSPTRGLRKGVAGRNYQYHAAPRHEDKRVSRGSANIPTITEHDEEEDWPLSAGGREPQYLTDAERKLRELERVLNSPDPFSDQEPNPLGSHPISPELAQGDTIRRVSTGLTFSSVQPPRRDSIADRAELPAWPLEPTTAAAATTTATAAAAEPLLRQQETGRTSPSKASERTSSTLSERSAASSAEPSLTRTTSSRAGTMLSAAAAARTVGNGSPDQQQYYYSSSTSSEGGGRTGTMSTLGGGRKSPLYYQHYTTQRTRSSTNGSMQNGGAGGVPNSAGTDADSFVTARSTNFALLQSEGEALLGSGGRRPSADYDDPYRRAAFATRSSTAREGKTVRMYDDYPSGGGGGGGIPTIAPPRRRQGWMGSLRRALNAVGERNFSLTGGSVEQYGAAGGEGERTASSSPTKERGVAIGAAPRRAVSDGGTLLKQKRGQKDWEDGVRPRYRDDPDPGDWGEAVGDGRSGSLERRRTGGLEEEEEEEDWDVEGAARKRDVQVMFTVPKARLRVVNADMDRASMRSASEGALSRSGSVRVLEPLQREGSGRLSVRARSEGDRVAGLEEADKVEGLEAGSGEMEEKGWGEKEKAA
ncbi:hypothetical protein LTR91_000790 [Friedmanniomyces endolithicus]|uniref:Galactose oxidase n=1 Tax=Friedmanniomyces endolithicus TaxID=329885 RepID=A0AAN6R281_9PEZI|nr:hypothetical protein LTR94_001802 [Friedmanniomyces endolithicus]KAK0797552.1 hypothetical protein LTR59_006757 [Friedmanniomyces endolithicus]KAK0817137.1 hypothetical protein LTR38_001773 [Friedmanniomyces endolithicus]KAK0819932.1 hypothetical protein LTR75_001960 [Friedmanniomyces endolithicus]KAK0864434.1 hypothetical protein LTS02_005970 [Friedmanniomyces endolithicus]